MKTYLIAAGLFFFSFGAKGQAESAKEIFAFNITSYIVTANDSITVVQVQLPAASVVVIDKEAMGLLKHNYANGNDDTSAIAWGKCRLIKLNYYYFGLHLYNLQKKPQENDLLYTHVQYPAKFKGRIYNMVKNAVYFEHVAGGNFFYFDTPFNLNEQTENSLVDSLVADIKFTGKEMQQQNNGQNMNIVTGIFAGKKLFNAMQAVTSNDVKDFLDYVTARPQKYAGNTWKIAETFATWMTNGTPTVKRE